MSGVKQKGGTTWTVLSTGVPCSQALRASKSLLGPWASAQLGQSLSLPGYSCFKMTDLSYDGKGKSSGGGLCHVGSTRASSVFDADTFAFRMTGAYTIAQIKQFFHLA